MVPWTFITAACDVSGPSSDIKTSVETHHTRAMWLQESQNTRNTLKDTTYYSFSCLFYTFLCKKLLLKCLVSGPWTVKWSLSSQHYKFCNYAQWALKSTHMTYMNCIKCAQNTLLLLHLDHFPHGKHFIWWQKNKFHKMVQTSQVHQYSGLSTVL